MPTNKNDRSSRKNPENMPKEGQGSSHARSSQSKQGKEGQGTQKRPQERKP